MDDNLPSDYKPLRHSPKDRALDALTWLLTSVLAILMLGGWSVESRIHGLWVAMESPQPPAWIRKEKFIWIVWTSVSFGMALAGMWILRPETQFPLTIIGAGLIATGGIVWWAKIGSNLDD